jgi:dihydrofolate synthase/folylpolyglutamate synthase
MNIKTIEQAEKALHAYFDVVSKTGDNQSLSRMWPLLDAVGNPHEKLKVIHVAGTSGKTSTCYYISALLQASGKKVGLTVSPHVDSITERVQINGSALSDEDFCTELNEFLMIVKGIGSPSYFELLIVFVLWVFARQKVDYVVLETGMGGLFDGTNVVSRPDKVCVITHVGYDHMNILGTTLASIAAQKAGIIHENNSVFSQHQSIKAAKVIKKYAQTKKTNVTFLSDPIASHANDIPAFQQANWEIAKTVVQYIARRDGFMLEDISPVQVVVPGRMEIIQDHSGIFIMDGAHNRQKMDAFVESFKIKFPNQKATVLLALKEGKELEDVLLALLPITQKLIATEFSSYQDVPFRAQSAKKIALYAQGLGIEATAEPDYKLAFKSLQKTDAIKIVTGSFYLLGQIRSLTR